MNTSYTQFDAEIDRAQDVSLNILLGAFSAIVIVASLAFGIASAVLILAFTALRIAIRHSLQLIDYFQEQAAQPPRGRMEEPIIFAQAYRRRYSSTPRPPIRKKVRRKVVRPRSLYAPALA